MKKKLESDVGDLDTALEHANAANCESQKSIKKYQQSLREVQARYEEETRAKEIAHDNLLVADRRAHANQNALEEARTLLEQADRSRRVLEQEVYKQFKQLNYLIYELIFTLMHPLLGL